MISSTTGKSGNRPDYHSQGDESKRSPSDLKISRASSPIFRQKIHSGNSSPRRRPTETEEQPQRLDANKIIEQRIRIRQDASTLHDIIDNSSTESAEATIEKLIKKSNEFNCSRPVHISDYELISSELLRSKRHGIPFFFGYSHL